MMVAGERKHRLLGIVSTLTIALFAVANLPWTLDDYDQAKQAFVSYQMVDQGRWFYQATPSASVSELGRRHSAYHNASKPPGLGWISAGLYLVSRSWDLAWRLPGFLAALLIGFLLFVSGRRAFGEFCAVIAVAAFGLNMLSVRLATLVRTDMPLALASFAVGLLFFEKIRSGEKWTWGDRLVLFALLSAAMFVKGPIIYAFVLPPLVIFQTVRRWRGHLPNIWSGWTPWLGSLALFIAWVAIGIGWVPGFYEDVVLIEFLGRFQEGIHRSQPFLFYLPHLLHKFSPWSVLMLALLIVAWRQSKRTTGKWAPKLSAEMFWLTAWALGGIVVLSLIPSKRVDRIFPAVAPLCLLLAAQMKAALDSGIPPWLRRLTPYFAFFAMIEVAIYCGVRIYMGYAIDRGALEKFGREVRRLAAREKLHYEVLPANDEGLLLYLQRPGFYRLGTGTPSPDAIVAPLDQPPWKQHQAQARLTVEKKGEHPASYGFFAPVPLP